jgi:hypothetical protein
MRQRVGEAVAVRGASSEGLGACYSGAAGGGRIGAGWFRIDCVSVSCFSRSRAVAFGFGEAEVEDEGVTSAEFRGMVLAATLAGKIMKRSTHCLSMLCENAA